MYILSDEDIGKAIGPFNKKREAEQYAANLRGVKIILGRYCTYNYEFCIVKLTKPTKPLVDGVNQRCISLDNSPGD